MDDDTREPKLGTQEYWDSVYELENRNFQNHGDPGDIWFGEDSVERVMRWINRNENINKDSKILDLGCGNGMFLIELSAEGFTNLNGVDYCESAVKLAKSIAEQKEMDIKYWTCDITKNLDGLYDVIHDKGTFDVVSLSQNSKENKIKYLENVSKSLENDGFFIITSCNWTKDELDLEFKDYFKNFHVIPTPEFKFGGKVGNVVTSLVYKKI